jgi:hypothetical protein
MVELRREACERICRVLSSGSRGIEFSLDQTGACMTVPQTPQVRCWRLE